ncbi:MAG: type VI secretion system tube protein Hcp [Pseudomonadota bacterium]
MPFDAFLKIEGIDGESTDDKHKNWIEVLSYSWGVSQMGSGSASGTGGAAAARADFQDFSAVKILDKASPALALACSEGRHIKEVKVELCRAGGDKMPYMEYKMTNALVSSVSVGGGGGGEPTESLTFNYGKIEWTYSQQKRADGSPGGKVPGGWDLEANKKV